MSTFNWAEAGSGHMSNVALTTTIALSALHLGDDTAFMFGSSPRNVPLYPRALLLRASVYKRLLN
jgi:hypothetical protein